ncbi:fibropellin-1-like isoform X1 [Branchiostoma lanceolatum]|uniref:fibropellin-1-like isoform X1 n=1 Tax=Branchiostoma lanceolatum TaxID=7740 RepID=UPI00345157DF
MGPRCTMLLAVFLCALTSTRGQSLMTSGTWEYLKVQASGTMTSANVKATCEGAGLATPCPGDGGCAYSSSDCVQTGLTGCLHPMEDISQALCNGMNPRYCPALEGVYTFMAGWTEGAACGAETGSWCAVGTGYSDRFALCARDLTDQCAQSPCQNGGTCTDTGESYTCDCWAAWTGDNCETDVDECLQTPCQNQGSCTNTAGSYSCSCTDGWTGQNCGDDVDECLNSPCENGGTCVNAPGSYSCTCAGSAIGRNCETILNDVSCYRFSTDTKSFSDADGYCKTLGGYLTKVTTLTEQEYLGQQILQGTAVSHWIGLQSTGSTYEYADASAISGELRWMPGKPEDLCVMLAQSGNYDLNSAFCSGLNNYICESDVTACDTSTCQNGGTCTTCFSGGVGSAHTFCDCAPGYAGNTCETDIDECSSAPCQNQGTCTEGVNSYSCSCPTGFDGDNCEIDVDLCNPDPCPANWRCDDFTYYFTCTSPGRSLGEPVHICLDNSNCPAGFLCLEGEGSSFMCMPE